MRKTIKLLIATILLALHPINALQAVSSPDAPLPATRQTVVISEIYPDAIGTDNDGLDADEFIEIHNLSTEYVTLEGVRLSFQKDQQSPVQSIMFERVVIEPSAHVAILPKSTPKLPAALTNTTGTVFLDFADGQESQKITYTDSQVDPNFSLSLFTDQDPAWQLATPTPGAANELPQQTEPPAVDPPGPEPSDPTVTCTAPDVHLSELLANPAGADTDGGEFIELYNAADHPVVLEGCQLRTDKMQSHTFTSQDILAPQGYGAVPLHDELLNGGGTVWFITATQEEVVEYPELADNKAWALVDATWQQTDQPTPGAKNLGNAPQPPSGTGSGQAQLEPCPAGKFRNPETNRCKNIDSDDSMLTPCSPGQERNPQTNRCRGVTASSSSLVPCKSGYERNPETNRCRKVSSTSDLTPCKEGYERNPQTNRCRKIAGVGTASGGLASPASASAASFDAALFAPVGIAAGLYGLYEYRQSLRNWLRKTFTKSSGDDAG